MELPRDDRTPTFVRAALEKAAEVAAIKDMSTRALGAGEDEAAGERLTELVAADEATGVDEGGGMQAVPPTVQAALTLLATVEMENALAAAPLASASALAAEAKLEEGMDARAAAMAFALTPGVATTALQA